MVRTDFMAMKNSGKILPRSYQILPASDEILPRSDENLHPGLKGFLKSSSKSSLCKFSFEAEKLADTNEQDLNRLQLSWFDSASFSKCTEYALSKRNHARLHMSGLQDCP